MKKIRSEQEWLERRREGVGASDTPPIVLKEFYGKTPLDIFLSKMGRESDRPDESRGSYLDKGNTLEPVAIQKFRAWTGIDARGAGTDEEKWNDFFFVHPEHEWWFANLDAVVGPVRRPTLEEIVEIKNRNVAGFMRAKNEGMTDAEQLQAQHQMGVTGAKVNHFVVFSAELWDLVHVPLERDEEMIALIFEEIRRFWFDHVVAGVAPDLSDDEAPVIKSVGGDESALDVSGDDAWREALQFYLEADAAVKAAAARREEAEDLIKGVMEKSGREAVRYGRSKVTWRLSKPRRSLDRKALAAAYPEINLDEFMKVGKPSRSFRVNLRPEDFETEG